MTDTDLNASAGEDHDCFVKVVIRERDHKDDAEGYHHYDHDELRGPYTPSEASFRIEHGVELTEAQIRHDKCGM